MSNSQTYTDALAYAGSKSPKPPPISAMGWTADGVAARIIEAFRIDRRMPRIERPKSPGSAHPTIEYSREERDEWETIPIDPRKFMPSKQEQIDMERAFGWLRMVLEVDSKAHAALRSWSLSKAGGGSFRDLCRKNGLAPRTMRDRKDKALSYIVSELKLQSIAVF